MKKNSINLSKAFVVFAVELNHKFSLRKKLGVKFFRRKHNVNMGVVALCQKQHGVIRMAEEMFQKCMANVLTIDLIAKTDYVYQKPAWYGG